MLTMRRRFILSDRKSTRLNSSHLVISYAVFCLKKKKQLITGRRALSLPAPPATARAGRRALRAPTGLPTAGRGAPCLLPSSLFCFFFFLKIRHPPNSTLFPYRPLSG